MAEPPPSISTSLQLNKIPKGGYKVTVTGAMTLGTVVWRHESEHPSQITLNIGDTHPDHPVENAIPATTFSKFKQLPPEIRAKIWGFSLDQPRVFWPSSQYEDYGIMHCTNFAHKPPAVRQACREARKLSDRRGEFSFGWNGTLCSSLWFDFTSDILLHHHYDEDLDPKQLDSKFRGRVRNVALRHYEAFELEDAKLLKRFLRKYPRCKKIIFVWSATRMTPVGDIKLYPIPDNELLDDGEGNCDKNWGELKALFKETWREELPLTKWKITANQLPIIEAAECIYVEKKHRERRWVA
ncbi:hypothetical protein NW752_011788 [Fusarium irregulare]|uniref:2EXR domain-containing protein n=1 Tax=Fusarium irregulare TaxID=2494466 RepID=A0A9W8PDN0_9HYPO|nr:hypothetical protein NW766_012266 [Fusarium irregulare]KAJ4004174.1 hypothetical protein NW752_011788 [Fusarium irregulare]